MMTAVLLILIAIALIVAHKRDTDQIVDTLLAIENREIERRTQRGIQSGFDAGWHGAGPGRPGVD